MSDAPAPKLRIDKWLWHARFFKTRSLASKVVSAGKVRVNRQPVAKPSFSVTAGDIVTFPKDRYVRVIQIDALGERRGPAPEAQALYTDLDPPKPRETVPAPPRFEGKGRPTKKDRRALEQSRPEPLE